MQDTDLFADMGPTALEDAWQWLPLQARITLVHFLSQLPQLAQQLSNSSPESRQQLDDALQQLVEGAELTHAQRNALKVATELVVCGEEVSVLLPSACQSDCMRFRSACSGLALCRTYVCSLSKALMSDLCTCNQLAFGVLRPVPLCAMQSWIPIHPLL
jgi:hypothetical protein